MVAPNVTPRNCIQMGMGGLERPNAALTRPNVHSSAVGIDMSIQ